MAVYPTEFQAPAAYEAVDSPVFLGVDPMLLALLVAFVAMAAFVGWYLGRLYAPDRHAEEAAEAIHKAILKATEAALSASSRDLYAKAEALRDRIRDLLGPVMVLGKGVASPFGALEAALAGKPGAASPTPAPTPAAPAPSTPGSSCDCGAKGDSARCKCGAAAAVSQVTIINGPIPPAPTPPPPPPPSPPSVMTREEQIDALSRAVRVFHDYWSHKDARIEEMRKAREALGRHP
ncbi:hypothetical protein [Brevundimonas halotolerans]|uniref:Uncharacterized protein n=1 Tax=Brevundimonas halotolerans TaxID=69670 RepID=A0A7W9A2E8_9CAUL|nr:hypothetical protein [Brevundimonas halotolerans]MBB5660192.1 hypothetical protein [Brevundimonas halotolerans]